MIRHIVLVKFLPHISAAEIDDIWRQLRDLQDKVDGLLNIHAGRSGSPEQMERGYMHGFTIDFTEWQALHAYLEHPDHKELGGRLVAAAQGGIDGILVFDLEI